MSSVDCLRVFVNERLSAAAEEIFGVFQRTIVEYQEEIDRQRGLLDVFWKPEVRLHRIKLPQPHVCKKEEEEEEVLSDQQLCLQERNPHLVQEDPEPPQIEEEQEELCRSQEGEQLELQQEAFTLTPTGEERDHDEDPLLDSCTDITQSLVQETSPCFVSVESAAVVEPSNAHQPLSHNSHQSVGKDQEGVKLRLTSSEEPTPPELPQPHVCKEEEVLSDQQLCLQERNPRVVQEDPEPPQIKEEQEERCRSQEGEQLEPQQEAFRFPFLCEKCGKCFKHKNNLLLHVRKAHRVDQPYVYTSGRRVIDESVFKTQKRIPGGERPYSCLSCGKTFTRKTNLKSHARIHSGEKPYSCITCGKTFTRKRGLKFHTRGHTGERPYSCNTCGKTFTEKSILKSHVRIHSGEKPYSCITCGKSFTRQSGLKFHTRCHTGERPYSCIFCGKTFSRSDNLNSHKRTHTVEKPYSCKICKISFKRSSYLTVHMRRSHGGETS